jgi:hypothetical protein
MPVFMPEIFMRDPVSVIQPTRTVSSWVQAEPGIDRGEYGAPASGLIYI